MSKEWLNERIHSNIPMSRREFLGAMAGAAVSPLIIPRSASEALSMVEGERKMKPVTPGEIVRRGDPTEKQIIITLDDLWFRSIFRETLDLAKREGAVFTFLPVGRVVAESAGLIRRAVEEGHSFENHTHTHGRLDKKSVRKIMDDVLWQHDDIEEALGHEYTQHFLRPPGGYGGYGDGDVELRRAAERLNLAIGMWSVDSRGWYYYPDSSEATIDKIVANVLPLYKGQIILMHGLTNDLKALGRILRIAKNKGYRTVSMRKGIPHEGTGLRSS